MSKRSGEDEAAGALKDRERPDQMDMDVDDKDIGEFADEFEDEFESEDEIMEAGVDGRPDAEREAEEKSMNVDQGTFIIGRHKLEPGQHPWPCLSFDLVRDHLGSDAHRGKIYPATMYAVAGTQAESARSRENHLMVVKLSGLGRVERDAAGADSDDEGDEGDDDEDSDPILESRTIPLGSTTNRIRAWQASPDASSSSSSSTMPRTLTAAMTESSDIHIHDNQPQHTIRAHKAEGYALDWSSLAAASRPRLLTGDNDGLIYLTAAADEAATTWSTEAKPFRGHASSVEDIQWSPSEPSVFASASSDGTVRVWDVRSKSRKPAITVQVSSTDVNVLSWSRQTSHLLASGADDGVWAVWDLRQWKAGGGAAAKPTPLASFDYHKEQVTSIEWHPTDDSVIAVAAADNTVTLWDLAVELDDEESKDTAGVPDIPQLLFIVGSLVATGEQFSVFRTISV
ncbi:unnamed protein product [Parascedosporium putredinis]|uniref:Glutamate-rich WD repeat-containing protein 1 n=1 Tax=Parascedosporium putredinis TaxID=1442378 RepID=A0A9P1HAE3_9PEZI|nr:unnamed protein product [Parascedosporium putredinis]CAI8002803.1 unnamed protein product [Parascedosporium putredinis]